MNRGRSKGKGCGASIKKFGGGAFCKRAEPN